MATFLRTLVNILTGSPSETPRRYTSRYDYDGSEGYSSGDCSCGCCSAGCSCGSCGSGGSCGSAGG